MLGLFEAAQPLDLRPRQAIAQARAWAGGTITMTEARTAAGHANAAARDLRGAARHAAYAAAQAAAVAHVAAHELGAAAYALSLIHIFTMVETDSVPADWVVLANQMDELWTPSSWGADVFRSAGITMPDHNHIAALPASCAI